MKQLQTRTHDGSCDKMQFNKAIECLMKNSYYHLKSNEAYNELLGTLKNITEYLKDLKTRKLLNYNYFNVFATILRHELELIKNEEDFSIKMKGDETGVGMVNNYEICTECLRCLRNACVECHQNQTMLCDTETIYTIKKIIETLPQPVEGNSTSETALRCAVQVLSNAASGNKRTQYLIWKCIFPDTLIKLLKNTDGKVQTYTCVLIHQYLTFDLEKLQILNSPGLPIIESILELSTKEAEQDWTLQIIKELLKKDVFVECYDKISNASKVTLLDIIAAILSSHTDNSVQQTVAVQGDSLEGSIPQSSLDFLADKFEEVTKPLTELVGPSNINSKTQNELLMSFHLLKVICLATSNLQLYRPLQDRTSLLTRAVGLLHSFHLMKVNVEQSFSPNSSQINTHPNYGFKRDLIQLIGNMCFRHTGNQNKVRELEGIQLLLDNCTIDPHNPFINQWATLAIRNVCENNLENQQLIEAMKLQGVESNSMLGGMGIETQLRDGQVYIKTKPK